jgi:hypothetical protein
VHDGLPATLLVDSAAAALMAQGKVDAVVVGADRVVANGDTANKIGTFSHAVAAAAHGIPFFVAAPTTTLDAGLATGEQIEIEQRPAEEITHFKGQRVVVKGINVSSSRRQAAAGCRMRQRMCNQSIYQCSCLQLCGSKMLPGTFLTRCSCLWVAAAQLSAADVWCCLHMHRAQLLHVVPLATTMGVPPCRCGTPALTSPLAALLRASSPRRAWCRATVAVAATRWRPSWRHATQHSPQQQTAQVLPGTDRL